MILMGVILVWVLMISIRKGQYDDMDGEASRILMDDDLMPDNFGGPKDGAKPIEKQKNRVEK